MRNRPRITVVHLGTPKRALRRAGVVRRQSGHREHCRGLPRLPTPRPYVRLLLLQSYKRIAEELLRTPWAGTAKILTPLEKLCAAVAVDRSSGPARCARGAGSLHLNCL